MAIVSSFFNSISGDRKYKAEHWAEYFSSFIGNGYFADKAESLKTVSGSGMVVTVHAGKAFINGYFMYNTSDYMLTIPTANGALPRIDRIVVRWSLANRNMTLAVKSGTASSYPTAPELQRDNDVWELAIAEVYVPAGAISITSDNITDLRIDENYCGIVAGVIKQFDTSDFVAQYNAMLDQLEEALKDVQDGSAWVIKIGDTMTGSLVFDEDVNDSARPIVRRTIDGSVYELHTHIDGDGTAEVSLYGPNGFDAPVAGVQIKNGSVRVWPQLQNIRYVASVEEIANISDKQVGDLFVVPAD